MHVRHEIVFRIIIQQVEFTGLKLIILNKYKGLYRTFYSYRVFLKIFIQTLGRIPQ
jgi:hypothetical protein